MNSSDGQATENLLDNYIVWTYFLANNLDAFLYESILIPDALSVHCNAHTDCATTSLIVLAAT
jgi:hypothetical protein